MESWQEHPAIAFERFVQNSLQYLEQNEQNLLENCLKKEKAKLLEIKR